MMQYRSFGKLDWKTSALGFGCMRLPTIDGNPGNIDQDKTDEMIHAAINGGVNYFDTAYPYHEEQSESALGKALGGGYRERVSIATKSPIWLIKESSDFDKYLEIQLERLQTDTVDFYLLHALNNKSWEKVQRLDVLGRAEAALADGRIRHLGFSFHDDLETFKQIIDDYNSWEFCQIQYNYMDISFQAGAEGLHYAALKGLAVIVMEPLLGGKLALDLPATRTLWDSADAERTPVEWALQWLWSQPEVSMVLSGMSTLEQVRGNIRFASASRPGLLNEAELELIDRVREVVSGLSPIPCTRCGYCMPCPHGVDIPRNFDMYNKVAMYDALENSRFAYEHYIADAEKAAACIQCDECLPKCPQQIAISTWMPVVDDVLGQNKPFVKTIS